MQKHQSFLQNINFPISYQNHKVCKDVFSPYLLHITFYIDFRKEPQNNEYTDLPLEYVPLKNSGGRGLCLHLVPLILYCLSKKAFWLLAHVIVFLHIWIYLLIAIAYNHLSLRHIILYFTTESPYLDRGKGNVIKFDLIRQFLITYHHVYLKYINLRGLTIIKSRMPWQSVSTAVRTTVDIVLMFGNVCQVFVKYGWTKLPVKHLKWSESCMYTFLLKERGCKMWIILNNNNALFKKYIFVTVGPVFQSFIFWDHIIVSEKTEVVYAN